MFFTTLDHNIITLSLFEIVKVATNLSQEKIKGGSKIIAFFKIMRGIVALTHMSSEGLLMFQHEQ